MKSNLVSLFWLAIIILMTYSSTAYGSQQFLETTTKIEYDNLLKCIKDKHIYRCTNEFEKYLKNEVNLIKSSDKNDPFKKRLTKIVDYLQKSTDVFHEKAKEDNDIEYWRKASICAFQVDMEIMKKLLQNIKIKK